METRRTAAKGGDRKEPTERSPGGVPDQQRGPLVEIYEKPGDNRRKKGRRDEEQEEIEIRRCELRAKRDEEMIRKGVKRRRKRDTGLY